MRLSGNQGESGANHAGRYFPPFPPPPPPPRFFLGPPGKTRHGWGGTDVEDPLTILKPADPKAFHWPGLRLLMISTHGRAMGPNYGWIDAPDPQPAEITAPCLLSTSERELPRNCEPSLLFGPVHGRGGRSLRAGVERKNPVRLTRSVKDALTYVVLRWGPEAYCLARWRPSTVNGRCDGYAHKIRFGTNVPPRLHWSRHRIYPAGGEEL